MALKLLEPTLVLKFVHNILCSSFLPTHPAVLKNWLGNKRKNMDTKILCPTCSRYPAIMHAIYGPTACEYCKQRSEKDTYIKGEDLFIGIGKSKKEKRMLHWDEIRSRVKTHEGELLSGRKGKEYIQKYGRQYLGMDTRPANYSAPQYQRELAKTK